MDLLNPVMNAVDRWTQKVDEAGVPQNFVKRRLVTRAVTVLVATPAEVFTVAQNIILVPVHAVTSVCKLVVKTFRVLSSAELLKKMDEALPGPTEFIKTVLRVIAYAIGTVSTLIIGFISPSLNFKMHCGVPYLNLAVNYRENKVKEASLEAEQLKRAQEEAAEEQAVATIIAMLEKAYEAEKEAELAKKAAEEAAANEMSKVATQETKTTGGKPVDEVAPQAKKPGFFKRLFGYGASNQPQAPKPATADGAPVAA